MVIGGLNYPQTALNVTCNTNHSIPLGQIGGKHAKIRTASRYRDSLA